MAATIFRIGLARLRCPEAAAGRMPNNVCLEPNTPSDGQGRDALWQGRISGASGGCHPAADGNSITAIPTGPPVVRPGRPALALPPPDRLESGPCRLSGWEHLRGVRENG
ncbi:MAG: hypothetical protein NTW21_08840 [Verrucomicrobia bacterium]|nr:hypothetical protein [Verrucomicrobiota bacterium]